MTQPKTKLGAWLIAVRPWSFTGSVLAVLLGQAIAYYLGYPVRWTAFAVALTGVVLFQIAANLLNDCFDYRRGLDTVPNPASGAVVRGLVTDKQVLKLAVVCLALGTGCGLYLYTVAGWMVLVLGVLGALIVMSYTTSGICLKYVGLGDPAIFLTFGILPVFGTFWVQTLTFDWLPIIWSVPLVMFTVGILHANNWRDLKTDAARGCKTFATYLGDRGSEQYYRLLMTAPFACVVLMCAGGALPSSMMKSPLSALLSLVAVPMALKLVAISRARTTAPARQAFVTLDARTAQVHMVFGLLLTVGFVVGRHLPLLPL